MCVDQALIIIRSLMLGLTEIVKLHSNGVCHSVHKSNCTNWFEKIVCTLQIILKSRFLHSDPQDKLSCVHLPHSECPKPQFSEWTCTLRKKCWIDVEFLHILRFWHFLLTYPQLVQSQLAVDQRHLAIIAANIHGYFSQKSAQINSQKHLITLKCIVHLWKRELKIASLTQL